VVGRSAVELHPTGGAVGRIRRVIICSSLAAFAALVLFPTFVQNSWVVGDDCHTSALCHQSIVSEHFHVVDSLLLFPVRQSLLISEIGCLYHLPAVFLPFVLLPSFLILLLPSSCLLVVLFVIASSSCSVHFCICFVASLTERIYVAGFEMPISLELKLNRL